MFKPRRVTDVPSMLNSCSEQTPERPPYFDVFRKVTFVHHLDLTAPMYFYLQASEVAILVVYILI